MRRVDEVGLHEASDFGHAPDDLDEFLQEESRNPEFRAAYEDARVRSELLSTLVRCRGQHRVSQAEVAARMSTTQSAVSDLERGATDPRLSTLQRYARAIGCQLVVRVHTEPHGHRGAWQAQVALADMHVAATATGAYWEHLARHIEHDSRPPPRSGRWHDEATQVAPVELQPTPGGFAQAAV